MILKKIEVAGKLTRHPVLRRLLLPKVHEELTATYTRNLHKWLLIAPLIGLMAGLTITPVAVIICARCGR
jgi:CIC family chloride channel protein